MKKCLIHPECRKTVEVNNIDICYECWNKANIEEREWFKKVTDMYNHGLITRQDLDDTLFTIGYHETDPTVPIFI